MDCSDARIAISARLDGEGSQLDGERLAAHLTSCTGCQTYTADIQAAHRRLRLSSAEPVPDLTPQIFAAINAETEDVRDDPRRGPRAGLAAVAVIQILIALPAMLMGEDAGLPAHTARHLGSFSVALGIGFLVAAWRPERVGGLLPLTAALVACLFFTSGLDAGRRRGPMHCRNLVATPPSSWVWDCSRFSHARRGPPPSVGYEVHSGPSGGAAHS